jgi:CHAD domain-containing protein
VQKGRKSITWVLPESLDPEPLVDDFGKVFSSVSERPLSSGGTWFDTFDWRLYQHGFCLFHDRNTWYLFRHGSEDSVASLTRKGRPGPVFSRDFPPGRIRSILEPILEMRSLLPLVTCDSSASCLRVLNKDRKTVARVFLEGHRLPEHDAVVRTVRVQGVRGYDKKYRAIREFFSNYGIRDRVDFLYPFLKGVEFSGRRPLDYSSKFVIKLKPDFSARKAMILIYTHLLGAMQQNEAGVLDDLDSEFLHDFRVAVRRTRSGLGQVGNVLPPDITGRTKKDFAWLGKVTGPTRDLDVYLLSEQNYRNRLPGSLQAGLDTFFADISVRRDVERRKLVLHLQSDRYQRIIHRWQEYLEGNGEEEATENSSRPVIELAREIISRKYAKIIKDGRAITPASPAEDLHRLRIQCKKLRYTLEFFSSLFPQKDMNRVIKQLKRLQNNLGEFNDLSVQQDMLHKYRLGLRPGSRKNQELAASLGGLSTNLYHHQHRVRENFSVRFKAFSAPPNARLYKRLFGKRS